MRNAQKRPPGVDDRNARTLKVADRATLLIAETERLIADTKRRLARNRETLQRQHTIIDGPKKPDAKP